MYVNEGRKDPLHFNGNEEKLVRQNNKVALTTFFSFPLKWRDFIPNEGGACLYRRFYRRARERHHEKQKTQLSHELRFLSDFHLLCNLLSGKFISREPAFLLLIHVNFCNWLWLLYRGLVRNWVPKEWGHWSCWDSKEERALHSTVDLQNLWKSFLQGLCKLGSLQIDLLSHYAVH